MHAERDDDARAIACYGRALSCDPYDQPARLRLGIAYVNELDAPRALAALREWVAHHPRLHELAEADIAGAADGAADGAAPCASSTLSASSPWGRLDATVDLMERAAACAPDDADVQCALGVLRHATSEYAAAARCFARAAALAPDDARTCDRLSRSLV